MAALDRFMQNEVEQFEPEIRRMAAYCLDTTGKRLRPTLVFVSGWQGEGMVPDDLVRAAAVVEMVHLATLVHDDIMDRAEIRRSRRTAAREFGPDAAVLLGDALFSQALHIAARFPTTEVCRVVSESTRKVCSGEIMQTLRRRDLNITLAEYRRMIDLKTAELFRVSCFLGARLSGQDRRLPPPPTVLAIIWASPTRCMMIWWISWARNSASARRSAPISPRASSPCP
jgi:octaprenyl-diphosphate synthase